MMFLFNIQLFSESLYSDDIAEKTDLAQTQLEDMYNFSSDLDEQNAEIDAYLGKYVQIVFDLAQLTPKLKGISNESIIYSDINRLEDIVKKIHDQIDDQKSKKITYRSKDRLTPLQSHFQSITYKLTVFTPYMSQLIYNDFDENRYLINYMGKIYRQMNQHISKMAAVQQQLGVAGQQSQLPFAPQSPFELSFALENQLTQSVIGMFGTDGNDTGGAMMPYSSIASPTNTDFFNMGGVQGMMPQVSTPNGNPLQYMNYMPQF